MNTLIQDPPDVSRERLTVTLLFSLILHVIVILGLSFKLAPPRPGLPALDITLLNTANNQPPKQADFLAQANNAGGGNQQRARRPGSPFNGSLPVGNGLVPHPTPATTTKPETTSGPRLVTTQGASRFRVNQAQNQQPTPKSPLEVTAMPLQQRRDMARLTAEIRRQLEHYARRPRRKFISANTRSIAYAGYMHAWVTKIERVGTLNFPHANLPHPVQGQLILTVGIDRNGHIQSIRIDGRSGDRFLDRAARRIVRLAAPFPPIPQEHGEPVDILYITRTWQFLSGNVSLNH